MKVAIVHDWLVTYGGAERVLEQMLQVYPDADCFTLCDFFPAADRHILLGKSVQTSFIQRLPFARKKYRNYLPLMPLAIEQFDLSAYDLVISSSFAVAKGVLTSPDQLHICMCYSPMRYAWDLMHQYLRESGLDHGLKGWSARYMLHRLRQWDVRTANGVDEFIAISEFIARRIHKVYRRESTVIYPPVDTAAYTIGKEKGNFYLTASRMVPYKKIDLIVEAFAQMPEKQLVVIGDGPDFRKIRSRAAANVRLLGYQPSDVLRDHMQRARAFVFAAEEDFGIVPLEAQACGTPVIAFAKGGALETVAPGESGVLFYEQSPSSLIDAIRQFEATCTSLDPEHVRANALRFGIPRFREEFADFVDDRWRLFLDRGQSREAISRRTRNSLPHP